MLRKHGNILPLTLKDGEKIGEHFRDGLMVTIPIGTIIMDKRCHKAKPGRRTKRITNVRNARAY